MQKLQISKKMEKLNTYVIFGGKFYIQVLNQKIVKLKKLYRRRSFKIFHLSQYLRSQISYIYNYNFTIIFTKQIQNQIQTVMKATNMNTPQTPRILSLKPNRKSKLEITSNKNEAKGLSANSKTNYYSARQSFHQSGLHSYIDNNIFPNFAITTHSTTTLDNFSTSIVKELNYQSDHNTDTNNKIQNIETRLSLLEKKFIQKNWNIQQFNKKIIACQSTSNWNRLKIEQFNTALDQYQQNNLSSFEQIERKIDNITSKLLKYRSELQFESLKSSIPSFSAFELDLKQYKIPYKVDESNISVLTETIRLQFQQIKQDIQHQISQLTSTFQEKRNLITLNERKSNQSADQSTESQKSPKQNLTLLEIQKKIQNKIMPFSRQKNEKNSMNIFGKEINEDKTIVGQVENIYHMDSEGYLLDGHMRYLVNDEGTKIKLNDKSLQLLTSMNVLEKI